MPLILHGHSFSSYTPNVLIALYENATPFAFRSRRPIGRSAGHCAAAPSLFYADWIHPIAATFPLLRAYGARLLGRPSFARCVDEARWLRPHFPLGAPDRD